MGRPKGLLPFARGTWLDEQLARARAGGVARILIVLGHHEAAYREALPEGIDVCVNPAPERGMFSSIQTGLAAAPGRAGIFLLPIDVPGPAPSTWRKLAATEGGAIVAACHGKAGHPILLRRDLVDRILALPSTERLDHALRRYGVTEVETGDENVTRNLNDPQSYDEFRRRSLPTLS